MVRDKQCQKFARSGNTDLTAMDACNTSLRPGRIHSLNEAFQPGEHDFPWQEDLVVAIEARVLSWKALKGRYFDAMLRAENVVEA